MKKPVPKPNIVEVFEHYGLQVIGGDRGGWRKAQCPIPEHEDRNPSASVNEDECKWWCHACSEGGDALDVVMRREDIALRQAVKFCEALEGGVPVAASQSSGLHVRATSNRPGRRQFTPPWLRG